MIRLLISLFLLSSSATASDFSRVNRDLALYDAHVAKLNQEFDRRPEKPLEKAWVKRKIQHMVDVDQYARTYGDVVYRDGYSNAEAKYFWRHFLDRISAVDDFDREELKKLLLIYGWFSIGDFDQSTDSNAWLIVQHADRDPEFQKRILKVLEPLVGAKQTAPMNYAYLFDRVAASYSDTSKRQPQRYGTQGTCVDAGVWEPLPMEDPANVDKRRAEVGLGPEADYISGFKTICKKVELPAL